MNLWKRILVLSYTLCNLGDLISQVFMTADAKFREAMRAEGFHMEEDVLSAPALRGEIEAGRALLSAVHRAEEPDNLPDVHVLQTELTQAISPLMRRLMTIIPSPRPLPQLSRVVATCVTALLYRSRNGSRYKAIRDQPTLIVPIAETFAQEWSVMPAASQSSRVTGQLSMPAVDHMAPLPAPSPEMVSRHGVETAEADIGQRVGGEEEPSQQYPNNIREWSAAAPRRLRGAGATSVDGNGSRSNATFPWLETDGWYSMKGLADDPLALVLSWGLTGCAMLGRWWAASVVPLVVGIALLYRRLVQWGAAALMIAASLLTSATAMAADYTYWYLCFLLAIATLVSLVALSQNKRFCQLLPCFGQADQQSADQFEFTHSDDLDAAWKSAIPEVKPAATLGSAEPAFRHQQPTVPLGLGGLGHALHGFAQGTGTGSPGPFSPTYRDQTGFGVTGAPRTGGVFPSTDLLAGSRELAGGRAENLGPGGFSNLTGSGLGTMPLSGPVPGGGAAPAVWAPLPTTCPLPQGVTQTPSLAPRQLNADEIRYLATDARWGGLSRDLRRAAPEIYWSMRQTSSCCREWLNNAWAALPKIQQFVDLWHTATLVDMRLAELQRGFGEHGLAVGLQQCDMLESMLRQLAAAREFKITGDAVAADSMLGVPNPAGSVAPAWLRDESRHYSKSIHQQELRSRKPMPSEKKNPKGRGRGRKGNNEQDV